MKGLILWCVGVVLFIAACIFAIGSYLQPDQLGGCDEVPTNQGICRTVDAIVVVSGGDTNARTDQGIELYQAGWASQLIFSGAAQDKSGPSNAAAMKVRAIQAGVPERAISIDEMAETTQENAANANSIFKERSYQSVILVTSGYHQRRASLEFNERAGDNVQIVNHPVANDKDWSPAWWLSPRGWWLAGGELAKIGAFYIRGATS